MKQRIFLLILMGSSLIAGCAQTDSAKGITESSINVATAVAETLSMNAQTVNATLVIETPTIEFTTTPVFTATPDNRMLPEDWKRWSAIPAVSGTVLDIYQRGRELGRNPNAFSKIGDCQNIKEAFMGFFDRQTVYLSADRAYLQETIDNFSGYFNRDGFAVEGGLVAPASLNPLMADPVACHPDESPLVCEIRVNNPAFAFVSFEFWYTGRSAENYEGYLRQVLDYLISEGVVPILLTKADNTEGDDSINYTIARLAYEYDLPMINWWYTAHTLPNNGMDPDRNDDFHISSDAWTERSYDALETLDRIWRTVRDLQ